jgi:circadian clock protein KaiA
VYSEALARFLSQFLCGDRYILHATRSESQFFECVERYKQQLDCLVLQDNRSLLNVIERLSEQGTLLPTVILPRELERTTGNAAIKNQPEFFQLSNDFPQGEVNHLFHDAEVQLDVTHLAEIEKFIDKAIAQFISLSTTPSLAEPSSVELTTELTTHSFLMQQQRRLSEKLKERLGYLGVYYKRNPQFFLRHLPQNERQKFLENLKSDYRQIVLMYFSQEKNLNQKIDSFVDTAFFADVSVSSIVEIHMELMEEFSKQLKLEGRSEEVLLDYRLTLIDVIAHLGEMYRRSIPRES